MKPTSPVSYSLRVDRGGKIPSRQGESGHVFDIRYLLNLGAGGEGEGEEVGLSEAVEFTSPLDGFTQGYCREEDHTRNSRSCWAFTALDTPQFGFFQAAL